MGFYIIDYDKSKNESRKVLDSLREDSYLNPTIMRGELRLIISGDETEEEAVTKVYGIVIKQLENLEKKIRNKIDSAKTEKLEDEYLRFKKFGKKLEKSQYRGMLEHIYGNLYIEKKEAERAEKRLAEIWKIRGDEQDEVLDQIIERGFHD